MLSLFLPRLIAQQKAKSAQNIIFVAFLHLNCSKMEERFVLGTENLNFQQTLSNLFRAMSIYL